MNTLKGKKATTYTEFGVQGMCDVETIKAVIPADELWPIKETPSWLAHRGFRPIRYGWVCQDEIDEFCGKSESLEEFVEKSQFLQAQAIVDGKAIEGGAVAMFQNAQATAKKPSINIAPDWAMQRLGVQTPQVAGSGAMGQTGQMVGGAMATGAMGAVAPQPTNPLQFGATNPMQFGTGNPLQFSQTNPLQFGATNPLQFNPQQNQLNVENANQNAESKDANKDENKEDEDKDKVVEKLEEILEKMEEMTDEIKDIFKE